MADNNSAGEKTEKPTPKRLQKAREEGQVAKSQELNTAFTLLASFMMFYFIFGSFLESLGERMTLSLSLEGIPEFTPNTAYTVLMENFYFIARLVAPVMLASAVVGALISFLQAGPLFTPKVIRPQLKKINPIEGMKRLVSLKSIVELVKSLAKVAVIAILTYFQLRKAWPNLLILSHQGIEPALLFIGKLIFRVALNVLIFMVFLGVSDYIYQRWDFMKNLRMTKQEIKEERKEYEGDPQIKSKRRQKQLKMSLNRMIKAMEEADVVITNPTHIAVALKFDIDTMEAPLVLAKGEGFIAEKIREKARELEIEVVENKPLARAINESTEIGDEIPVELYQAVAEVLAFVYRSSNKYK